MHSLCLTNKANNKRTRQFQREIYCVALGYVEGVLFPNPKVPPHAPNGYDLWRELALNEVKSIAKKISYLRASSILPRQSGLPPAFWGADLGVDLQKKKLQLKRVQPGQHRCLEMLSILTTNAPQIMARASNCGAHAFWPREGLVDLATIHHNSCTFRPKSLNFLVKHCNMK